MRLRSRRYQSMGGLARKAHQLKRVKIRNVSLNTLGVTMVIIGLLWVIDKFVQYMRCEITNDAYVDQYIVSLNVRVSGYIAHVKFREH